MIVFLKVKCKDGKYEFTEEELRNLISDIEKEAYDNGYSTGYKDGVCECRKPVIPTTPSYTPCSPFPVDPCIVTCADGEQIPIDFNGIS